MFKDLTIFRDEVHPLEANHPDWFLNRRSQVRILPGVVEARARSQRSKRSEACLFRSTLIYDS